MEIKILGGGCNHCKRLLERVNLAKQEMGIDATVLYVTDMKEIATSGLLRTPGLIIDQQVVATGKVPSVSEIKALIQPFLHV